MNEHQLHHGSPHHGLYGHQQHPPVYLQRNEYQPVSYHSRGGIMHQPIPHQGRPDTMTEYQPVHQQVPHHFPHGTSTYQPVQYGYIKDHQPVPHQGRSGTTGIQPQVFYRKMGEHPLTHCGTTNKCQNVPYGTMSRQQPELYKQIYHSGNVYEHQYVPHSGTSSPVQFFYDSHPGTPTYSQALSQPLSHGTRSDVMTESYRSSPVYLSSQPFSVGSVNHGSENCRFIDLSQTTCCSLNDHHPLPQGTIRSEHQTIPCSTTSAHQQLPYGSVNQPQAVPYYSAYEQPVLHGTVGDHRSVSHGVLQEPHQVVYNNPHGHQSIPYGFATDHHQYSPLTHTTVGAHVPPPPAYAYPLQRHGTVSDLSTVGIPSVPYSSISEYHHNQTTKNRPAPVEHDYAKDQSSPDGCTMMREHYYHSNKVHPPVAHPLQHQRVNAIMKEHHVVPQKGIDGTSREYQQTQDSNIGPPTQMAQQEKDKDICSVPQSPTCSRNSGMSDTLHSYDDGQVVKNEYSRSNSYGGELANGLQSIESRPEPKPEPNQAHGKCIMCKRNGMNLYKGTRYQCHGGTEEQQKAHNKMCYHCAKVTEDFKPCFIHLVDPYFDYEEYPIVPTMKSDL